MSRATPKMRDLAERLIAGELGDQETPSREAGPPAFLVCEKLGPELATLMGRGGYHALLSRALALTRRDVEWMHAVILDDLGSLGIAPKELRKLDAQDLAAGSTMLVAELLGLLVAFIGDNLTLRLIREVWPTLSIEDLHLTNGEHS